MKLRMNEHVRDFEAPVATEEVIRQMNEWIGKEWYFLGLSIDGDVVTTGAEQALFERLPDVHEVVVLAEHADVHIPKMMASVESYVTKMEALVVGFANALDRDQIDGAGWEHVETLVNGIEWVVGFIDVVDRSVLELPEWERVMDVQRPVLRELSALQSAVTRRHTGMLALMLREDIVPLFTVVRDVIGELFETTLQRPKA